MPLILGTNSIKDTGYDVANSCRFNDGSTDYLNRTGGTATNDDICTFSVWLKISDINNYNRIFTAQSDISGRDSFYILNGDLNFYQANGSTSEVAIDMLFRDPAAWYHIVIAGDSTQATASNRIKIYVNGVQQTVTGTQIPQNQNFAWNNNANIVLGADSDGSPSEVYGGYMSEVVFIDGQQLDPTSFGEFDEDSPTIWKPIDVSGLTFGNNGFYLDFEDSSALGNDVSGNNNDFTSNNLAATDQSTDTCTNNFATMNPLQKDNLTLSEGNLTASNSSSSAWNRASGTIGVTSGKWYSEFKMTTQEASQVGVIDINRASLSTTDQPRTDVSCYAYKDNGQKGNNNSDSSYGDTFTDGDILGIALDLNNHKIYFSKNGTFQNSGVPTSGSTGTGSAFDLSTAYTYTFIAAVYDSSGNGKIESNFGGTQSFTVSSGNSDANGYGNFEYAVPSGYYALNSKNLAEFG